MERNVPEPPPMSLTSSSGTSARKRLGMDLLVDPNSVLLQAWLRYRRVRARVMPT